MKSVSHYQSGLRLLGEIPESIERDRIEVEFQNRLCTALNGAKGWSSEESILANRRARELCERLGDTAALLDTLRQLRIIHWIGAEYQKAVEVAVRMAGIISAEQLPISAGVYRSGDTGVAEYLRLWPLLAMAKIPAVAEGSENILLWYDQNRHGDYRFHYGIDVRVATYSIRGYCHLLSANVDRALSDFRHSLEYARTLDHESSTCWALTWGGMQPAAMLQDITRVSNLVAELRMHQHSLTDLAWMNIYSGWVQGKSGAKQSGIDTMLEGLHYLTATNSLVFRSVHLALLAELYILDRQFTPAMDTLNAALAHIERSEERIWEPEIHRLIGTLQVARKEDESAIEASFVKSLNLASALDLSLLELRAATNLAVCYVDWGKTQSALQILESTAGRFGTEFDFPDLVAATNLLDQLTSMPLRTE